MAYIVIIIVLSIIALQVYFFRKNVLRMKEYKDIFEDASSWSIVYNEETDFVTGINGQGNSIFESIRDSINKYLENNSGSVIDFNLLKDTVDRHCDSVENDVNTLTPTPLYCGLAGTMIGVILGLISLIFTGSITDLLSSGTGNFGSAAEGVTDLLSGVAWAMLASIMGILLTTRSSILFKKYKLLGESRKNTFLAWLQAKLLPELPSDTTDALNRLVKNLNRFNNTFATNTSELRGALSEVNESYRIQGDIIQAVHDMDVMRMADANVRVLQELQQSTDKLEQFNQYLDDIHGYTDAIHRFTSQFEQEANRLHVLEEIKLFFTRHKEEIAKESADVDVALKNALNDIKDTASSNSQNLNMILVQQAEEFKRIINEERASFEDANSAIKAQFRDQIGQLPMLQQRLIDITKIVPKLDELIRSVNQSNNNLSKNLEKTIKEISKQKVSRGLSGSGNYSSSLAIPKWMKWTGLISVVLIMLACVSNTLFNILSNPNDQMVDAVISSDSLSCNDVFIDKANIKSSDNSIDDKNSSSIVSFREKEKDSVSINNDTMKSVIINKKDILNNGLNNLIFGKNGK